MVYPSLEFDSLTRVGAGDDSFSLESLSVSAGNAILVQMLFNCFHVIMRISRHCCD